MLYSMYFAYIFVLVNTTGICIQVISEQDCRGDLVDVSRQIADQCKSNELSLDDIDHYRIGSKLKGILCACSFAFNLVLYIIFVAENWV